MQSALGADVPMVAVFDTAFHRALPPCAANYPLPHELTARHGLRRFGFHGIAHDFMLRKRHLDRIWRRPPGFVLQPGA